MSEQLDAIEAMLRRLCRHLGVEGAPSPAPSPEDTSAMDEHAQKVHEARKRDLEKLFNKETDELTPLGERIARDGWMVDGV